MQTRPWITLAISTLTLLAAPGQASFAADTHQHHDHHGVARKRKKPMAPDCRHRVVHRPRWAGAFVILSRMLTASAT